MTDDYYGRDDYTDHIIIDINNSIVIKILKLIISKNGILVQILKLRYWEKKILSITILKMR